MPRNDRPGTSRCNCRPASATGSAITSAWCRATIRRWWIRWRAASDFCRPIRSGCRSPKAAARNCRSAMPVSVGRLLTEFVELQQVATRKQIQIMSENTRCPGDKAETAGLCRRRCRLDRALSLGNSRQAQIGVRPSGGTSGLRIAVPRLSRNAVAAGAALLFDLVVAVGRSVALQRHRRRGRGRRQFGTRHLQRHLLELPRRPPRRRDDPRHGARNQGRLPAARRSHGADHHDRPRHGAGAIPRLPAGARRAQGQGRKRSARRCCFSAAVIPIRIISMPTS